MKKLAFLITSLLALGALTSTGCTEAQSGSLVEDKQKSYNVRQENTDGGESGDDCKDGDCNDGKRKDTRPEFKFVEPGNRRTPPHEPHKRPGNTPPAPMPFKPETN